MGEAAPTVFALRAATRAREATRRTAAAPRFMPRCRLPPAKRAWFSAHAVSHRTAHQKQACAFARHRVFCCRLKSAAAARCVIAGALLPPYAARRGGSAGRQRDAPAGEQRQRAERSVAPACEKRTRPTLARMPSSRRGVVHGVIREARPPVPSRHGAANRPARRCFVTAAGSR